MMIKLCLYLASFNAVFETTSEYLPLEQALNRFCWREPLRVLVHHGLGPASMGPKHVPAVVPSPVHVDTANAFGDAVGSVQDTTFHAFYL